MLAAFCFAIRQITSKYDNLNNTQKISSFFEYSLVVKKTDFIIIYL